MSTTTTLAAAALGRVNALEFLADAAFRRWYWTPVGSESYARWSAERDRLAGELDREVRLLIDQIAGFAPRRFERAWRLGHRYAVTQTDGHRLIGAPGLSKEAQLAARAIAEYFGNSSQGAKGLAALIAAEALGVNYWSPAGRVPVDVARAALIAEWEKTHGPSHWEGKYGPCG